MSGIAACWRRSGQAVDRRGFQAVAGALGHRAIDGEGTWSADDGSLLLWQGAFRTTPEEIGPGPWRLGGLVLSFDGRIDNREALGEALGLAGHQVAGLADAELVLRAFDRWGEAGLPRIAGPFAFILWDAARRELHAARDALGRRGLFLLQDGERIVLASEPGAVLGDGAAAAELDDVFLAHYFALRRAPLGRTLYRFVSELPAGHASCFTAEGRRDRRHAASSLPPIHYPRMEDYAARFAELLARAVARRLRALGPPAVTMSGGLDSTTVAALAARDLAGAVPPRRLDVLSYVFDDLSQLDERRWMAPMVERYGLRQVQVPADEAWPLCDFAAWRWSPNGPDSGPFRPLNERLYAAARAGGHRVLLTGAAGDSFFVSGRASWLEDLVADGRGVEAAVELLKHLRRLGPRAVLESQSVRRLGARLLRRPPGAAAPPPWLTAKAARRLVQEAPETELPICRRRAGDRAAVLASMNQSDGIAAGDGEHRARVELRDPFSDHDLVAFMLSIPAYALYNRGQSKLILRQAAAHLLPEPLLRRATRSDIAPLFWRGVGPGGPPNAIGLLRRRDAFWSEYVAADSFLDGDGVEDERLVPALLRWRCLSFEWWMIRRSGGRASTG